LHPSAIALFEGEPKKRVLIESPRRVAAGLKAKGGFSKLETFYRKMPEGFRTVHKGDPLSIEFWSFGEVDEESRDIAHKLAQRIDTPVEWLERDKLSAHLEELRELLSSAENADEGLDAVVVLLNSLSVETGS